MFQLYQGKLCASVLANKTVYIPANITQAQIEEKLESAFTVVSHSEYVIYLNELNYFWEM